MNYDKFIVKADQLVLEMETVRDKAVKIGERVLSHRFFVRLRRLRTSSKPADKQRFIECATNGRGNGKRPK